MQQLQLVQLRFHQHKLAILFATIFAIGLGKDEVTWVKIVSAVLIFAGVYLVTQKKEVRKQ